MTPDIRRTLALTLATAVLSACGASTSSRQPEGNDSGPDAGASGRTSAAGGKGNGGAGGTAGNGAGGMASGGTGAGGAPDAGSGGAPSDASASGGSTGDASTGADGALGDASVPACRVDGVSCSSSADAAAVCCGGQCVPGDCCAPTDCVGAKDGGAGFLCSNHRCVDVAGSLAGLQWLLPCLTDASSVVCNTVPTVNASTTVGGAPGVTYDVTLHFRGIVEQKTYNNGCADGYWLTGGADDGDAYNVYRLDVSSPKQTFFLNRGASSITRSFTLDYEQTIRMDAGATVTLSATSVDNQEIKNVDDVGTPLTIPGTSIAQPYNGQFIQMDVVSVAPDAVSSGSTIGGGSAGSALSFDGTQQVSVPDAPSLRPTDLTVEEWFQFNGAPGSYNSLLGKPYQTGSTDSYVLWYQSGAINAGVAMANPAGAATTAWTPVSGEWHHAAMTFDGTAQRTALYIDGLLVSCVTTTTPAAYDTQSVLIGADVDNGSPNGFWSGALDEIRVFSRARTATQIWADMHTHSLGSTTPGLVAEWTFDEGSGQTSADLSGSGNTATLGGTIAVESIDPTWVQSTVPH